LFVIVTKDEKMQFFINQAVKEFTRLENSNWKKRFFSENSTLKNKIISIEKLTQFV